MSLQLRGQIKQTYNMGRFESGDASNPSIAFDASRDTGLFQANGVCVSHEGTRVMQIGDQVTIDTVLVGNGAGLSGIHASNVTGLTAALDVIDASSVTANVFVGDGAGLSNVSASNVTGLTAALDMIDASSVTANTFVGDGAGLSNIAVANVVGDLSGNVAADDLTVTTLSSDLLPSANVTYDIGSATQRFRDLYLSGNTIDLAGALIQALGANVFIQNLDVGSIRGNGSSLSGIAPSLTISNVQITNSSYAIIDDTALSVSGGYCLINGSGFAPGCLVQCDGTNAISTSYVSSSQLRARIGGKSKGSYNLSVIRADSTTVTLPAGITFSDTVTWLTGSSLGNVIFETPFSIQIEASSDSNITYNALTTLPPSTTLDSLSGNVEGNIANVFEDTVYSFTVSATDEEFQDATRTFTMNFISPFYLMTMQADNGTASTTSQIGKNYNTTSWLPIEWNIANDDSMYSTLGSYNSSTFTWTSGITGPLVMMVNIALIGQNDNTDSPRLALVATIEKNGVRGFGYSKTGYIRRSTFATQIGNFTATLSLYTIVEATAGDTFRVVVTAGADATKWICLNDTASMKLSHWTIVSASPYQLFTSTNTTQNINTSSLTTVPINSLVAQSASLVTLGGTNVFTVQETGLYKMSFNLVYQSTAQRPVVYARWYHNGVALPGGSRCGYIRNQNGHNQSSLHSVGIFPLTQGDTLTIKSLQDAEAGDVFLISNESSVSFEQLVDGTPYVSYTTSDTSNFDVTSWKLVTWTTSLVTDSSIVTETSTTKRTITQAGYYTIHLSISYTAVGERTNLRSRLRKNGVFLPVEGNQGYVRTIEGYSSTHINVTEYMDVNDQLEVLCAREDSTATGSVTIVGGQSLWQIHLLRAA